jgi:F-type H+-transporting ATPase subunit b
MRDFFRFGKGYKVISFTFFLYFIFIAVSFASSGGSHGETAGWLATDTYRVMNFAVLAVALFYIVKKPAAAALKSRIDEIKDRLTDLEEKKEKALKQAADYDKKFTNINKESESILAGYIKQGETAKIRILEQADETAKKMEEVAKKNVDYQFTQAKKELQKEIVSEALLKAKELIKSKINPADHKRLIDEYLDKVVA